MEIQADIDLQGLNTLGVPSRAQWYCRLTALDELDQVVEWAAVNGLSLSVLGGGSNALLPEYLPGLTLHIALTGIEVLSQNNHAAVLRAAAGENWHRFVNYCVQHGYYGLENLALIPGTVGAAPIQNIGAYGVEVDRFIERVEWFEFATRKLHNLTREECQFAYRDSIFKRQLAGCGAVTHVTFSLPRRFEAMLDYPGIKESLASLYSTSSVVDADKVFHSVCHLRHNKLPDPDRVPNCGSFFKNPLIETEHFQMLQNRYPDIPGFAQPDGSVKVPAAWLIDRAGFKQKAHRSISVHPAQALVIINPTHQPLDAVLEFAGQIVSGVTDVFGIQLEREPQLLGSF